MEIPAIETEIQVMFFGTDCAAVVHNLAYLRFIEVARTLLAEKIGMSLRAMAETRQFPVVVRTEIVYRRTAALGDTLVIHGRVDAVERTRFWCAFEVRRRGDDALIATSRQLLALIQMPEGRPIRLPAEWATRFPHLVKGRQRPAAGNAARPAASADIS